MAIELSPFDPNMFSFMSIAGTAHAVAGQYEKAIERCRRSLRENRMFASTHRILAISLALSGRVEESRTAARDLLELEPTLTVSRFEQRYPGSDTPRQSSSAKRWQSPEFRPDAFTSTHRALLPTAI